MNRLEKIIFLCVGVLLCTHLHSQCTDASQIVTYFSNGNHTLSSLVGDDEGFSVAGSVEENGETDYVFYQFLDELNIQGAYRISSDLYDWGGSVIHAKLSNGSHVIAGYSEVGNQRQLKIICFDQDNILWQKGLEGTYESPRAIRALDGGGLLLVGSSETQSNGSSDAFALEMDQNGNVIWKKGFGDLDNEHFYDASTSFDGLHLAVGNNKTVLGTHRPVIATMDNLGNLVDYNIYVGTGLALFGCVTKYEGIYYAGGYVQQSGDREGIVVALDQNFEFLWSKRCEIEGADNNYVSGIGLDDNGYLYASVHREGTNASAYYLRMDPNNGDLISSVTTTPDIDPLETATISNHHYLNSEAGILSVANFINSGDFAIVRTNECLDNGECLEDVDITLSNYNLTRNEFDPDERILPDVFDITEFQLTSMDLPVSEVCTLVCSGVLSIPDVSGCVNEDIGLTFDFENEASEIESYFWELDDGTSSESDSLTFNYPFEISQDYGLTITTENGCIYSDDALFTVDSSPELADLETEVLLCDGDQFILEASNYPEWIITDSNGDEVEVFVADQEGDYEFTFSSSCSVEEINITLDQVFVSDYIDFEDQIICTDSDVEIEIEDWQSIAVDSDLLISSETETAEPYQGIPLNFTFSEEGIYTIEISGSILNCPVSQQFEIEVVSPPESFLQNTYKICEGDTIDLDFSDLPFNVLGSDGGLLESIQLAEGGIYSFTGQNGCSSFEEIITVNKTIINPPSSGSFQFLCEGQDGIVIGFTSTEYDYQWESGSQDPNILVFESGQYEVSVTDSTGACTKSFNFQVNDFPFSPSTIFEFPAVDICLEGQKNINFPPQFGPYAFSDTLSGFTYTATETETLTFSYSDECYTYQDSLLISVESCLCPVWVPNVFTPDEDGLNDVFKPIVDCGVYDYRLSIFNRWGREIFQSVNIDEPWRGESPNTDFYASHGVYAYKIIFNQKLDGLSVPVELTGTVMLLR